MPPAELGPCLRRRRLRDASSWRVANAFHINQNRLLAHYPIQHNEQHFTHYRQSRRTIRGRDARSRQAADQSRRPASGLPLDRVHGTPRVPSPSACATCEPGRAAGTTATVGDFAHWCLVRELLVPAFVTARVTLQIRALCGGGLFLGPGRGALGGFQEAAVESILLTYRFGRQRPLWRAID